MLNVMNLALHPVESVLKGLLLYVLPMPTLVAALSSLLSGNVINTLITGGAFFATW